MNYAVEMVSGAMKLHLFPKCCVFYFLKYRIMEKVQNPSNFDGSNGLHDVTAKVSELFAINGNCFTAFMILKKLFKIGLL
jgi:hypothetical protein